MMRNAVSTGLVDFVLRAEEIPAKLADYFGRIDNGKQQEATRSDPADYVGAIAALIRAHTGHDLAITRSAPSRGACSGECTSCRSMTCWPSSIAFAGIAARLVLLFQDLLIGVTNFFRDPDAFAALEREVIPKLFQDKGPEDTVRVWVPGCATGEEAYSIAILLRGMRTEVAWCTKVAGFCERHRRART